MHRRLRVSASHASSACGIYVCACRRASVRPPAHSVRACVHGRKCIYAWRADAQCTDCAGAGAVDNPMGWSANPWKADRTNGDCEGWCHEDLIVPDTRVGRSAGNTIRQACELRIKTHTRSKKEESSLFCLVKTGKRVWFIYARDRVIRSNCKIYAVARIDINQSLAFFFLTRNNAR